MEEMNRITPASELPGVQQALSRKVRWKSAPSLDIFDLGDVARAVSANAPNAQSESGRQLKKILDDMSERGSLRLLAKYTRVAASKRLALRFPNFQEFFDRLEAAMALARLGDGVVSMPPTLLVGEPGVGKTYVATEIAQLMGVMVEVIHMESTSNGGEIGGMSLFWSTGKTGRVFTALVNGTFANPFIVIDEVDKVSGDPRYDPLGPLYSLLEPRTAATFRDEAVPVPIDASRINWILTANDVSKIPAPIRSRLAVIHVRNPTRDESVEIAKNIYRDLRAKNTWGRRFAAHLDDEVAERLSEVSPREMYPVLANAFGRAAIKGARSIGIDELSFSQGGARPRVGFVR